MPQTWVKINNLKVENNLSCQILYSYFVMPMLKAFQFKCLSCDNRFERLMCIIFNDVFDIFRELFISHNQVMCMGGYLCNSFTLTGRIELFVFMEIFGSLF